MSPSVKTFNKARYKALMDGLDATEVMLSELKKDNYAFRIDSNFFGKQVLSSLKAIEAHKCFYLHAKNIVNGPFGSTITSDAHTEKGYMPLVRSININSGFFISKKELVYISKEDNEIIKHSQLVKDDIVLSRVGSIGFFARVDADMKVCNISSNNIGIKLGDYPEAERHYILTYLNTELAKQLTIRRVSGNVQQKLTVSEICHIPIPMFSNDFYKLISNLVLNSEITRKNSFTVFASVESVLLSALKTGDLATSKDTVAIKALSDSFSVSGRLDAEYYQPKYDEYVSFLHTDETVNTMCKIHDKGYRPIDNQKYRYIELSNVDTTGNISDVQYTIGKDLPSRARRKVKKGQVIISSIEGSLQSCALITDEYDDALCSTGFYILTSKFINPETLLVLFKSEPIQALIKQRCSGTILTAVSKAELLSMPFPKIGNTIQKEVASKVQESFALRYRSEQLLEYAKRAVELAIEQGEKKAMEWLKGKNVEV